MKKLCVFYGPCNKSGYIVYVRLFFVGWKNTLLLLYSYLAHLLQLFMAVLNTTLKGEAQFSLTPAAAFKNWFEN